MNLDLVIVVLNNSSYGMIKWKQQGSRFEDYGLDFGEMDFIKLAESFGASGYKITKKEDFKAKLEEVIQKS
jgi:acetolactate synthase-1/2/3 large subunit